jgi:hypothetical protein
VRTVILVPFRSDGAERERNWAFANWHWGQLRWPIFTGDSNTVNFERSRARNTTAHNAGLWDVALFVDADIVVATKRQAREAVRSAWITGAYTVAYDRLVYLTEWGTKEAIRGEKLSRCETDEQVGLTWECCFAVRRDLWDMVGGFDTRFRGWCGQVAAFFYAAATFGGRERVGGVAYHLAHPLVDRTKEPFFRANIELAERYKTAVNDPTAMTAILEER